MRRLLLSVAIAGVLGWAAATAVPRPGDAAREGVAKPKPGPVSAALVARP